MTEEDLDGLLSTLASTTDAIEVDFRCRPQLSDPKELVLEAAVNGKADALVTHNFRHFATTARLFGLRVQLPGDLLKELQK